MKPILLFIAFAIILAIPSEAQQTRRQLPAVRTNATFKIDGTLSEPAWKEAVPATDFIEVRPKNGAPERNGNNTVVYILYDNNSIYVGGYCHEVHADSVSKELAGRDGIGASDFVGIVLDTYNDKINAVGFFVTPYGEQFDAKYSVPNNTNNGGEDPSWNAVWESAAKVQPDGWSFEMKIPYSALRFNNKENQTWGLNLIRNRTKAGEQYSWNYINTVTNGFINQEGEWTGIQRISPPLRLSLTPYLSAYANHYPYNQDGVKNLTTSVNGGMDLKYGINQSFTLDMTLVPDFGQVQSDNVVLNLTPFEIKYNENRSFFTEGTELFNKGNLFYSRRIGGTPILYNDIVLQPGEKIVQNPTSSKLINATKISGRTSSGLGIGFFNALTEPMYATIQDSTGKSRKFQTDPLTNYNIIVLDQNLKNNSSVSLINTSVIRAGDNYNADVAAALFNFNNKKNTYNWNGKVAVSNLYNLNGGTSTGYAHRFGFGKSSGFFNYEIDQDLADNKYNPNDLGILFNNNYLNHYGYFGFHWNKPGKWYNRLNINNNFNYNRLFVPSHFENFNYNGNVNGQFKNLMFFLLYYTFTTKGYDFFEPHVTGRYYKSPGSYTLNAFVQSNQAKKYSFGLGVYYGQVYLFNGRYFDVNWFNMYRFSDKFSVDQSTDITPIKNNVGYADFVNDDVIFSRRDRLTVENIVHLKYNFNNKSGINFRARHYWSRVDPKEYFILQQDGSLVKNTIYSVDQRLSFNTFNIDMTYTLQFAPGSFLNIVWKNAIYTSDEKTAITYMKDFRNTIAAPQNNSLSVKVLYYFDWGRFRKKTNY